MADINNSTEELSAIYAVLNEGKNLLITANEQMTRAIQKADAALIGYQQDLASAISYAAIAKVNNKLDDVNKSMNFTAELYNLLNEYFKCKFEEV